MSLVKSESEPRKRDKEEESVFVLVTAWQSTWHDECRGGGGITPDKTHSACLVV